MKSPVIIDENGSLSFFKSITDAERYLEPIDIHNQEYVAYDSEGRRLELRVEEEVIAAGLFKLSKITKERVRIAQTEKFPAHAEELKKILQNFLKRLEASPDWLYSATLQQLVAASAQRMGFS